MPHPDWVRKAPLYDQFEDPEDRLERWLVRTLGEALCNKPAIPAEEILTLVQKGDEVHQRLEAIEPFPNRVGREEVLRWLRQHDPFNGPTPPRGSRPA